MKILVVSSVYTLSGVPLAQLRLAESLGNIGHDVDLVYGCKKYQSIKKSKYIKIFFLNKFRAIGMIFSLWKYLIFNNPDVIFSAEDHLNIITVLASIFSLSKAKISVSSRVTPIDTYRDSNMFFSKGWFLKIFFPLVNWRANVMTCVSKDMVKQYRKIFSKTKQVYAYNIVKTDNVEIKLREKISHKWFKRKSGKIIVAAGMLAKWKGFDDLIKAANIINSKNFKFRLVIFGSGPEKEPLIKLIKSYKLQKKVLILKPEINILKYFYNSDIFVLSSKVEGMPNVMIEAMMCGCTVVATNCATGPREILGKNEFGYLSKVNNPQDLSKNIIRSFKKQISNKKTKKIVRMFSAKEVLKRHFILLKINKKNWKL